MHTVTRTMLAGVVALGIGLADASLAQAVECGCAACSPASPSTCDCDACDSMEAQPNCLHKAVHSMKGKIAKLLSFAKCGRGCDEPLCDDACDAAMIDELMRPIPEAYIPDSYSPEVYVPEVKSYAPKVHAPQPAPLHVQPVPSSQGEVKPSAPANRPPTADRLPVPKPMPAPVRDPEPSPKPNGGSLFDTLDDPFQDDDGASVPRVRSVRPTSHYRSIPVPGAPLSRGTQVSSRRSASRVR